VNLTTNFFDLSQHAMREFFSGMAEKPYRATQVMKWVYRQGITDFEKMTDISKGLRENLAEQTAFQLPEIVSEQVSNDGTRKWLLRVDKKNCIETVFIPEKDRGTLCISSQVGCPLDCSFCSTGKQGFNRNLGVSEIIGQLWLANRELGSFQTPDRIITNVVMMGMGEPLLNFDNVVTAMDLMKDDLGFNLSQKRVTLSTAGVVPGIDRLAEATKVSLAVSLHAPNDEIRNELVPINRRYPVGELMAACRRYASQRDNDPITFEYVMLNGINDSKSEAYQLAKLLANIPAKVNLIPFNPFPGSQYICSPKQTINQFRDILVKRGIITITRKTREMTLMLPVGNW
jgi:23S rRNA (adenine2503-C2)-methyltransferase